MAFFLWVIHSREASGAVAGAGFSPAKDAAASSSVLRRWAMSSMLPPPTVPTQVPSARPSMRAPSWRGMEPLVASRLASAAGRPA